MNASVQLPAESMHVACDVYTFYFFSIFGDVYTFIVFEHFKDGMYAFSKKKNRRFDMTQDVNGFSLPAAPFRRLRNEGHTEKAGRSASVSC